MLVLSRKKGESFFVGDATVEIVEIRGEKVRLGIHAPKEVPVLKPEEVVYERISRQCIDRAARGVPWRTTVHLGNDLYMDLPTNTPYWTLPLLYVGRPTDVNALARAYQLPTLLPGFTSRVFRPEREYILVVKVHHASPEVPFELQAALRGEFGGSFTTFNPMLPSEVLLLAIEYPDLFSTRGVAAAGALCIGEEYAGKRLCFVPVLIRQESTFHWVVQDTLQTDTWVPLAYSLHREGGLSHAEQVPIYPA